MGIGQLYRPIRSTSRVVRFTFIAVLATLLLAGCGHFASSPSPSPTPEFGSPAPAKARRAVSPQAQEVALFSMALVEQSYKYGGKSPADGLDCSGLVTYVYQHAIGVKLKGNAATLAKRGKPVDRADLVVGDLVFFNTTGKPHSHVGIYLGSGRFIHALSTKHGIRLDRISSPYFARRFTEGRTVLN